MPAATQAVRPLVLAACHKAAMKHPNNGIKKHVVVIGAGFAGLSAARRLLERSNGDVSVTVLEGGHRVGGRAHTAQLKECGSVELGATWLHGLAGNPLFDLAVQEGLMTRTAKPADEAWADPSWVRECAQVPLAAEEVATAKAAAGSYSMAVELAMQSKETGLTVGHYLRRIWPQVQALQKFAAGEEQTVAEVWRWRECLQRSMDGCDSTDNMLAAGLAEYDELDGMNVPVGGGGFQNLAAQLASGIGDISYGHIVNKFNWGEGAAQISCTNGSGFSADAVIVTVSLGVLKAQHSTLFEPRLPPEKVEVIQRMGFGVVNKVFLASKAQWPGARVPRSFSLLWSVKGGKTCPLDDSMSDSWLRDVYSLRQAGSEFVGAKQLSVATAGMKPDSGGTFSAEPKAAESQTSPKEAPSTAQGPRQSQGRTACLWVTGPGALAMEHRSSAELAAAVEQLLETFPPVRDALPDAASIFRTTWGTDPLFRGSYSFVSAASSVHDFEELGRPVSRPDQQPVLFFAGEATHPTHYGTTHGAFITGQREADNVLRTFGMLQ